MLVLVSCKSNSTTEQVESAIQQEANTINYIEVGDSLTFLATQELLTNVARQMQDGGATQAIDFCNIHAMPIMDSLSKEYGVTISRISEKNRNPQNAANKQDKEILAYLKNSERKDSLVTSTTHPTYYKTIKVGMPTCLKCHGVPNKDITTETKLLLDEKYPNDKARGYQLGEFRGAWKVVFN